MAIEFGKGIALAGGFDLGAKAPLDSRLTVATIEERDAHVTGNRAYDGMLVFVEADKVTYQYILDAEGNGTWKEFGFNEADFVAHIANDLVTDDEAKALSAAQGVVLKDLIDTEVERAAGAEDELQASIDALDEKVGAVPEGSETVIGYVNKKAQEVLDAATGGSSESAASVKLQLDNYIAENNPKVAANTKAAADAQATADEAKASIDAFLKEADATETAIDTLKEIQAELSEGEASAASMLAEINALKAIDNVTQAEFDAVIETIDADFELKADKSVVDEIAGKVEALEAIDVATKEYVDQAETDAVNTSKAYADELNTAMDEKVEALEGASHEHANKEVIDGIDAEKVTSWDDASSKAHTHENAEELAKIVTGDVEKWNAIEDSVTSYVDDEITEVKTLIGKVEDGKTVIQTLEEVRIALDSKDAQVEANAKSYTDQEVAKVNAVIGEVKEGKTVLQLIQEAREAAITSATYDDTQVKADIATNTNAIAKNAEDIAALSATHTADKEALVAADEDFDARIIALESVEHVEIQDSEIDALFA